MTAGRIGIERHLSGSVNQYFRAFSGPYHLSSLYHGGGGGGTAGGGGGRGAVRLFVYHKCGLEFQNLVFHRDLSSTAVGCNFSVA